MESLINRFIRIHSSIHLIFNHDLKERINRKCQFQN